MEHTPDSQTNGDYRELLRQFEELKLTVEIKEEEAYLRGRNDCINEFKHSLVNPLFSRDLSLDSRRDFINSQSQKQR